MREERILERSISLGEKLIARLKTIAQRNDVAPLDDIRGLGAMVAFDLVKARGSHEPDPDRTKRLTTEALKRGLILLTCGLYGNGIRILVPINASDAIVDEAMGILEDSLKAIA
jgi:4-aminobutyrate aminotransferase/(S)-3-amino-2-methylpropionate transaminase